jgi:hypothetical protein
MSRIANYPDLLATILVLCLAGALIGWPAAEAMKWWARRRN